MTVGSYMQQSGKLTPRLAIPVHSTPLSQISRVQRPISYIPVTIGSFLTSQTFPGEAYYVDFAPFALSSPGDGEGVVHGRLVQKELYLRIFKKREGIYISTIRSQSLLFP